MTLIAGGLIAQQIAKQGIKQSRKQSVELFGYDFVRLMTQLAVFFLVAWIIEVYLKARVFLEKPQNQRAIGLGLLGIGGVLVEGLIRLFEEKDDPTELVPINDKIRQLFDGGIEIAGQKIEYWDIIKIGAMFIIFYEWYNFKKLSESTGSTVSMVTNAVFGLMMFAIVMVTIPKFSSQLRTVLNR